MCRDKVVIFTHVKMKVSQIYLTCIFIFGKINCRCVSNLGSMLITGNTFICLNIPYLNISGKYIIGKKNIKCNG